MTGREFWEALVEVEAMAGNDTFAVGKRAFVIVVLEATGILGANENLAASLAEYAFRIVELDYLRAVPDFENGEECTDLIRALTQECQNSGEAQFGPFHTWRSDS